MNTESPTILVVENDEACRNKIVNRLEDAGFRVVEASNGNDGWARFCGGLDTRPFSLVIADIEAPHAKGLEFAEKVRRQIPELPVIALSANRNSETVDATLRVGANDLMEKPLADGTDLAERVARLIESHPDPYTRSQDHETARAVRQIQSRLTIGKDEERPIASLAQALADSAGDIFWCAAQNDGTVLFALADVGGRSVEDSYAAASYLGTISTYQDDPSEVGIITKKLNQDVLAGHFPQTPICTMLGRWYPRLAMLDLASASLPHVWVYQVREGESKPIQLNGAPLGLLDQPRFDERVVLLDPGDRVLIASDGLVNIESPDGRFFGKIVAEHWTRLKHLPVDEALGALRDEAEKWGEGRFLDDVLLTGFEQPHPDEDMQQFRPGVQSRAERSAPSPLPIPFARTARESTEAPSIATESARPSVDSILNEHRQTLTKARKTVPCGEVAGETSVAKTSSRQDGSAAPDNASRLSQSGNLATVAKNNSADASAKSADAEEEVEIQKDTMTNVLEDAERAVGPWEPPKENPVPQPTRADEAAVESGVSDSGAPKTQRNTAPLRLLPKVDPSPRPDVPASPKPTASTQPKSKPIEKKRPLTLSPRTDLVASEIKVHRYAMALAIEKAEGSVTLDLSSVAHVDSLGVSLVVGLFKSCKKRGLTFSVRGANEEILRLFQLFRLGRHFRTNGGEAA